MKLHDRIGERLRAFLAEQPVFFVGTAPPSADGHGKVSPKGMKGTFRDVLTRWTDRKDDTQLARYRATKNARSIDGLPALAPESAG